MNLKNGEMKFLLFTTTKLTTWKNSCKRFIWKSYKPNYPIIPFLWPYRRYRLRCYRQKYGCWGRRFGCDSGWTEEIYWINR